MAEQPLSPSIHFNCTNCGKALDVPAQQIGREVGCPHCRAVLLVPEASGEAFAPGVQVETVEGQVRAEVQPAPVAAPAPVELGVVTPEKTVSAELPPSARVGQAVVDAPVGAMPPTVRLPRDEVPVGARRRYAEPEPPKSGAKTVVLAVAVVAVLGVAGAIYLNVKRNMERAEKTKGLLFDMNSARDAFEGGELEKAAQHAESVRRWEKELTDLGGELQPGDQRQKDETLKQISDYQERLKELDGLSGRLEADLDKVWSQLRDQRALFEGKGTKARPIVLRIEQLLARADDLARKRKLDEFRKQVAAAETVWNGGDTVAAREQFSSLRTRLAADEQLREPEVQARLDLLRDLDEKLTRARQLRAGVNDDFAGTRKKLDDLAQTLKAGEASAKVVLAEIEKLRKELEREEKTRLKLSEEQLKLLKGVADMLSKREAMLQVDQASPSQGVLLRFENQNLRLIGLEKEQEKERLVFNVGGYRMRFPAAVTQFHPGIGLRVMQALGKALREASADASLRWEVQPDAPALLAWANEDGKVVVFYDGKLYPAEVFAAEAEEKGVRKELADAAEALAQVIEKDQKVSERVRAPIVTLVRGAYKELEPHDYLPGPFCRRVLNDGYIELNIPAATTTYKAELDRYHKAHASYVRRSFQFKARRPTGEEVSRATNLEDDALFRSYDPQKDRTYFGLDHPVEDRPLLFVNYEFAGKHESFPTDRQPLSVRMTHPAVGVMASYDPATGKLDYDATRWAQGAEATAYPGIPPHFGTPEWAFPPHVLLMYPNGDVQGIVTTAGRIDLPDFRALTDKSARRKAQDAYLDQLAKVLNSTGYLHLYFLYFHQYVHDSPVETQVTLLGSRAHSGDIHQDVYQSLDRKLGGRYLGDCDDLAEMYMNVTRRQSKLSYVMSLPGHAACGWIEKDANAFRMQFVDTGPPRIVTGTDLEKVVEEGSRTYDREKSMRFDPKSVPFLFRFAGEATRTPYWLSCRMFYDREYAEIMERVQSYWHFHFYALGIKTMEEMIAKGDRVPENCVELAGLYGRVEEFDKSIHWTQEAVKQLGKEDVLSRLSETLRVGMMYREAQNNEGAYKAIEPAVQELLELSYPKNQEWMRYISQRMSFSSLLVSIHKPWHAWELFITDLRGLGSQRRKLFIEMAAGMANMLFEMKKQEQTPGRTLSADEQNAMKQLDRALDLYFKHMCFTDEDDFNDILRNYAFMGRYYGGKFGKAKLIEELLKNGPYPEKERSHSNRQSAAVEEDWNWIRLSMLSYSMMIGDAVDPDEPKEKWRKDEAIKLAEAMDRAAQRARHFGSLSSSEFMLFSTKVLHAFMTKNWKEFEDVLKEVKERDFARLTAAVAETFGQSARFVTADEFAEQYAVFAKYVNTRAPYFNAVYEAYRSGNYEHARRAAPIAVQRWPDDENMKREVKFLDELIQNRLKEQEKKAGAKKP